MSGPARTYKREAQAWPTERREMLLPLGRARYWAEEAKEMRGRASALNSWIRGLLRSPV
jgi:hypothetical protein